ncbi:PAS domain S-box protein [Dyella jejuensis]|uniref:histidine kinase n=1 Tax=Dyella jejuensis TaxID=1432009 RepID=A0ABW8JK78_9GAMM
MRTRLKTLHGTARLYPFQSHDMPAVLHRTSRYANNSTDYAVFTLDRRGYVVACHVESELFSAYRPRELLGKHYSTLYAPGSQDSELLRVALKAHGSGKRAKTEAWLLRRGGRRFRADISVDVLKGASGKCHGFVMIVRDINLRRHTQDRLRESERRFRLFVHGVTDYAICMLDPQGIVLDWNLGAQRITCFPAKDIVGRHFCVFFNEEQVSQDLPSQLLRQACEAGRSHANCELLRANRESFPAEVVIEAIHESDGSLIGFAMIVRDRTQQQLTERRLFEAREQMVHAQKIEAIGQLTGGIAHDFNNALQGIISSLELASLCLDRESADQAKRYVMVSLDAALRAGRLTQRLLSLARRQAPANHRTTVVSVLRSIRELLGRTLGDGIVLDVSFPEDVPPLTCDSGQLESALVNLAVNARDAMDGQGRLRMTSRLCSPADSSVQVALDPLRETYVEIAVMDDGPGMNEETRRRALEPFFTTKPEGHGTGLGLSMVYGFVTQYGGAIDIRSMPGAGTSVLLYLPCDDRDVEAPPLKEQKPEPNLTGFRILIVEDNETIRESVAVRLRQLGCQVYEAACGNEALSILSSNESWDLLLSDIDLPVMDGYELCSQARKLFPSLRVILMTGYADSELLELEGLDHATEALIKPFDMGDLLAKTRLLLQPAS